MKISAGALKNLTALKVL